MADEEEDEKKDKPKDENKPPEEKEGELTRTSSVPKKKNLSRTNVPSKVSLKKPTASILSVYSEASSVSLAMKRQSELEKMAKVPKYQNTYRLDSKKPFKPDEVYKILELVAMREIDEYRVYEPVTASKLAQTVAAEVRSMVRQLNYDRYKICVLVYVGEKKFHGFQAAFRALWDYERDGWATYFFQCRTFFLSCTCYGLYHD